MESADSTGVTVQCLYTYRGSWQSEMSCSWIL